MGSQDCGGEWEFHKELRWKVEEKQIELRMERRWEKGEKKKRGWFQWPESHFVGCLPGRCEDKRPQPSLMRAWLLCSRIVTRKQLQTLACGLASDELSGRVSGVRLLKAAPHRGG